MAEHAGARAPTPRRPTNCSPESEPKDIEMPVRSRWVPKPEQITLLESIFKSGKVNPSREETVRIRMMLEEYGKVADASIFYWFQNRRSKFKGRQRLLQASRAASRGGGEQPKAQAKGSGGQGERTIQGGCVNSSSSTSAYGMDTQSTCLEDLNSFLGLEYEQNSVLCSSATSGLNYQHGMITVFINEVPIEVVRGPVDMRAMFGGDILMYHSSGVQVQVNDDGIVMQSLHHGESYIVVITNYCKKNPFFHRRNRCMSAELQVAHP